MESLLSYPSVRLTRPLGEGIKRGHPWIYREALDFSPQLLDGEVVDLLDSRGEFVARGTLEPSSTLTFRAWTLDASEDVDAELVRVRLTRALEMRRSILGDDITGFRVCHGENDFIPGLQCDLYGDVASLRCDGALGQAWEDIFVWAVKKVLEPSAILIRNHVMQEGRARIITGTIPGDVVIQERSRRFHVSVTDGQKTGFFLDQRDNRERVGAISRGQRVLNLFSYTGGFSVAAAQGGASRVVTVDIAGPAVEAARQNFLLNGLPLEPHGFETADAFDVIAGLAEAPPQYDVIVLDPPSFASSRKNLPRALKAYEKLNELALKALPVGGWLATASCSSHLREADFLDVLIAASLRSGKKITLAGVYGAAPDHPTRLGFPEGHYLKFVLARVVA